MSWWEWLTEPLHLQLTARAMVMAVLLGVSGGLVGCLLLVRRMVLMADSFGHALLPGIALAFILLGPGIPSLFVGAILAGIATTLISALLQRNSRLPEDAAFGSIFIIAFALGVLLMSWAAAPVDLVHYLFGHVLGVTASDLYLVCATSCTTVLFLCLFYRAIVVESFDRAFASARPGLSVLTHIAILLVVVINLIASLQAVGMVLSLGLFILPAVTAYLWCERFGSLLIMSACWGAIGAAGGFLASYHLELASGACIVLSLGLGYVVSLLISPVHGLLGVLLAKRRHFVAAQSTEACDHE